MSRATSAVSFAVLVALPLHVAVGQSAKRAPRAPAASARPPAECRTPRAVPATAPNSVPAWIYADRNLIDGGDVIAGRLAKGVFQIAFEEGTSAARRTEIVRGAHGVVVGGVRMPEMEGIYYLFVCDATTPAAMLKTRDVLAAVPGVALAVPVMNDTVAPDTSAKRQAKPRGGSTGVVPALPPDSIPALVRDRSHYVAVADAPGSTVHSSVIVIEFERSTPRSRRAAIIESVHGRVIGGEPAPPDSDGPYYVQVPDDPTGARILALGARLDQLPGVSAAFALSTLGGRLRH